MRKNAGEWLVQSTVYSHAVMQSCSRAVVQSCSRAVMQSCSHAFLSEGNGDAVWRDRTVM